MAVPVVSQGRRDCGCEEPGGCPPGESCAPDDYIDPDDCPECPPGGGSCFELIAHAYENDGSAATTAPVDTTGATLLVAMIAVITNDDPPAVITDSEGNTWVPLTATVETLKAQIFYVENPTTSAAHTCTATGANICLIFSAYAGPVVSGVFDQESTVSGAFFTPGDGPGAMTPANDRSLVVVVWAVGAGTPGDTGVEEAFVPDYQILEAHNGEVFVSSGILGAFQVQDAATSTEAIVEGLGGWGGGIAAAVFVTDDICYPAAACPDCPPAELAPDDVEDLLFWYDGSDAGTLTTNSTPEDGGFGDNVTVWADKSGNGFDLTPSQGGFARLLPDALNGLSAVYFPGADGANLPRMSNEDVVGGQPLTIFAVVRFDRDGSIGFDAGDHNVEAVVIERIGGSFAIKRGGAASNGGNDYNKLNTEAGGGYPNAEVLAIRNGDVLLYSAVFDGASSFGRYWGEQLWATDIGSNGINAGIAVGGSAFGGAPLDGFVAELIGYNAALSAPQIEGIERYLVAKWFTESTSAADYRPYLLNVNAESVDSVIMAAEPFGYYVGDDASGNPQDSSGNGNHAVSTTATISYAQGALTTKTADSIAITAGGKIEFPTPAGTLMRDLGAGTPNPWTITGLVMFTARDGGDGGTERAWLSQLGSTGINWVCAFPSGAATSDLTNTLIGTLWRMGGDPPIPLDVPIVFAFVREGGQIGIWGRDIVKFYVNGVVFAQCPIGDGSSTGENFFLGRPSDEFWGAPDLQWSNLATFDRALTRVELLRIAEALLDAPAMSEAFMP